MATYFIVSRFPVGDSIGQVFHRRDAAYRAAWNAVRDQFKAQALLDRQCAWNAIKAIPADLRTIPVNPLPCGRRVLTIPCGFQREVSIHAAKTAREIREEKK